LMTAFAFILGCVPLWAAAGAGAISRQVLGTAVIGGMLAASVVAIFLIPVSYYIVERLVHREAKLPSAGSQPATLPTEGD
jgi:HAE1 family hydrophobic/amphiphilic exporter-1